MFILIARDPRSKLRGMRSLLDSLSDKTNPQHDGAEGDLSVFWGSLI